MSLERVYETTVDCERLLRMSEYDPVKYRAYYELNADRIREKGRRDYAANREAKIAQAKKYRAERPGCWRDSHFRRLYGITESEFDAMVAAQDNKCLICGVGFDRAKKRTTPHVDHCHESGKVRGVLCQMCNLAIGHIEKRFFAVLHYLGVKVS